MEDSFNASSTARSPDAQWKTALEHDIEAKVVGRPGEVVLEIEATPAEVGVRLGVATQLMARRGYRFATETRSSTNRLTIRFSRD